MRALMLFAMVLLPLAASWSVALADHDGPNRPPVVGPILAVFVRPDTVYLVSATDPDPGDELTYEWSYAGIGGCTGFQVITEDGVIWGPHDQEPPCFHDAQ